MHWAVKTALYRAARALIGLDKVLSRIEQALLFLGMLGLFGLVGFQVIARPLGISQQWTQELSQYVLIAVIFCGASLGVSLKEHASFEVLEKKAPLPLRHALAVTTQTVVGLFCVVIAVSGVRLVKMQMVMGRYTISFPTRLPMYVFYAIIPITFVVAAFHVIVVMLRDVIPLDRRCRRNYGDRRCKGGGG